MHTMSFVWLSILTMSWLKGKSGGADNAVIVVCKSTFDPNGVAVLQHSPFSSRQQQHETIL